MTKQKNGVICHICRKNYTCSTTCVCQDCRYKINYCRELGIPITKLKLKLDENGKLLEDKKVEKG